MTRKEYRFAKKLIRQNGERAGMRWMCGLPIYDDMKRLLGIQDQRDPLAERAFVIAMCKREGIQYNFRQIK